jgi:uncharacterized protein (TIGR02246 family)
MRRIVLLLLVVVATGLPRVYGEPPNGSSASEDAIRKMVTSYVEAFNKHDAQAVAGHWSPDAVYLNRTTGQEVVGPAAITEQFSALFKERPDIKLEVKVESIQFVSPNVAVERGSAKFLAPNTEPEDVEYTAIDVRRDGKWLLDRVTEKAKENEPSHHEQLKALEWMVGNWADNSDNADIEVECNWTKNNNFLTRAFKISIDDDVTASGIQIIGWDPAAKKIRSWTFDSKGAISDGTWEQKNGKWFIRNRGTLPDGRAATMINVMKQIGADSFTWQTIERTAGAELLPNLDEIELVRR